MGSLPGLTQKTVVEWGQEFTLAMNGAKTVDMVISGRRGQHSLPSLSRYLRTIEITVEAIQAISRVSTFTLHQNTLPLHCNKAGLPGDVLVQVNLTFIRAVLR